METIFQKLHEYYESNLVTNLEQINANLELMRIEELWKLIESKKGHSQRVNQNESEMDLKHSRDP